MGRFMWVFGVILLIATAAGASWYLNHNGGVFPQGQSPSLQGEAPVPMKIICMAWADIEPGVIKMYPVRPGEVKEIVREGQRVTQNQVLLKLDPFMAQNEVDQAQADLTNALELEIKAKLRPRQHEFQVKQLQAKIDSAMRFLKAAEEELAQQRKNLETIKNINLKPYEEKVKANEGEVKFVVARLDELKLEDPDSDARRAAVDVQAKRLQLAKSMFGLAKCELKAPSAGTVLQTHVNAGEVLGANPTLPALIFAPDGPRIVRAEVIQEWASRVAVGQEAFVEDDTYQGSRWKGHVKQVADWDSHKTPIKEPFMMIDQRVRQCIIEILPTETSPQLRIGQRLRVAIVPNGK